MSNQALAVVEGGKEARLVVYPEFSNEQIRILGETVAKNCDQNELGFFLNVCKLKRLDPFSGQVHVVKRWDSDLGKEKMTIQVGIDGFRVIAARTGEHAGTSEPEYDSEEGQRPNWAKVTVYRYGRNDEKIPYTVKARYSEFVVTKKDGNPNRMWATKPYVMLAKCAEAQALRKAFPDELSGMYAEEEMGQADGDHAPDPQNGKKLPINPPQSKTQAQNGQQQAQPNGQPHPQELSGVIEQSKQTQNTLWLTVKGIDPGLVSVPMDKVDGDMKPDYHIVFTANPLKNDRVGKYWGFVSLRELSPIQDGDVPAAEQGQTLAPDAAAVAREMFPEQKTGQAAVQGMVDNGTLKPASQIEKKTIGSKRAQRIYAIANQNKDKNGGFNEEAIKKILASLPVPLEHLSDLEVGMHDQFEKWADGTEDWKAWLESD